MTYREEIRNIIHDAQIRNEGRRQIFLQLTDDDGEVVNYLGLRSDECDGFGDDGHGIILVNAGAKLLQREKTTRGYVDTYSFDWTNVDEIKLAAAIWSECSCGHMELNDDADVDEVNYMRDKLRLEEEFETDLRPCYGGPKVEDPREELYEVHSQDADVIIDRLLSASLGCNFNEVNLRIRLAKKSGYKSRFTFLDYPAANWDTSREWNEYEELELTTRYNDDDRIDENEKKARAFLVNSEWYSLEVIEEINGDPDED